MFYCIFCMSPFLSNKDLLQHISLSHGTSKIFACSETNCARSFQIFRSFKRHRYADHGSDDESKNNVELSESFDKEIIEPMDIDILDSIETDNPMIDNDISLPEVINIVPTPINDNQTPLIGNTSNPHPDTFRLFQKHLKIFIAQLYSFSEIPKAKINKIIPAIFSLFQSSFLSLEDDLMTIFQSGKSAQNIHDKVKSTFEKFTDEFDKYTTETKRFNQFQNENTLILSEPVTIGERDELIEKNGNIIYKFIPVTIQYIPLKKVLKSFFEIPEIFEKTINYIKDIDDSPTIISNYIQGSLWKEKKKSFKDKTVFPLFLYYDDYEPNNALGSHKGISKLGAVYANIPCLPPQFQSKRENIFLVMLFNPLDRETYGNERIFRKLINDLNTLFNTGIIINVKGEQSRIYFSLELIIGDNLGIHSLLGFNESFRSNYSCRFCMIHINDLNTISHESQCKLRDEDSYKKHIENIDASKSGIKESCVFHDVTNFHFLKNPSVDIMHDILEGVCQYDLGILLNHFIYVEKKISLYEFNIILQSFRYDVNEKNKPPEIYKSQIDKNCITITAAEMQYLILNLGLMIGHLFPLDDSFWEYYLTLKKIVIIASSKIIHTSDSSTLGPMVDEFLTMRKNLFPRDNRHSIKFHLLLHYGTIMEKVGPLGNISSLRFESKHREGKVAARSAVSRVNIACSVALRQQLILNYRLLINDTKRRFTFGPQREYPFDTLPEHLISYLRKKIDSCRVFIFQWAKRDSYLIKKKTIFMVPSENGPEFLTLHYIIGNNGNNVYFACVKIREACYDSHYDAYKIKDNEEFKNWTILDLNDVNNDCIHITNAISTVHNETYINKVWI